MGGIAAKNTFVPSRREGPGWGVAKAETDPVDVETDCGSLPHITGSFALAQDEGGFAAS